MAVKNIWKTAGFAVILVGLAAGILLAGSLGGHIELDEAGKVIAQRNLVLSLAVLAACTAAAIAVYVVLNRTMAKKNGAALSAEQLEQNRLTAMDRMRFTRNTASARLVLLAIVFDVFSFVSIYKSDVSTWYYQPLIGASIIYNLIFLLTAFLSEEGVKNRRTTFDWVLVVIGLIQIARIFIIPARAAGTVIVIQQVPTIVMGDAQLMRLIVYFFLSAVCCIAAGCTSMKANAQLKEYKQYLAAKEEQGRA